MPPLAIGLVLCSIVLHVAWNAVLRTTGDPLRVSARGLVVALAVTTPVAAIAWVAGDRPSIGGTALVLALGSAVLETVYFFTLSGAYRRGELSVVYPIARGTAPVLAVAVGVLVLGEHLSPVAWLGVAGLIGGALLIRRPTAAGPALPWALACGCAIAGYSAVDVVAVRDASPWLYGWLLLALTTPLLVGVSVVASARSARVPVRVPALASTGAGSLAAMAVAPVGGDPPTPSPGNPGLRVDEGWGRAGLMGTLMCVAYLLVLAAFAIAPLAAVVPLREASVVVAALWGVVILGERAGAARKVGGAILIALGAVLLVAG